MQQFCSGWTDFPWSAGFKQLEKGRSVAAYVGFIIVEWKSI